MFDPSTCVIPTVYCGNKKSVPKKSIENNTIYVRRGTSYECMSKGFGAGIISEKLKKLPSNSLQRIKYVGDTYERNFKGKNIKNTDQLISCVKSLKSEQVKKLLSAVFRKKDGVIDKRAYNSTLVFLYKNGIYSNLPKCTKIRDL